jgi:hypothetical protein
MADDVNPLHHPRYTRANAYDAVWVFENLMGPNPLWLVEALTQVMPFELGMQVLDLGWESHGRHLLGPRVRRPRHWERRGWFRRETADFIEDGWKDWHRFDEVTEAHTEGWRRSGADTPAAMLRADQGTNLGVSRIVGTKLPKPAHSRSK